MRVRFVSTRLFQGLVLLRCLSCWLKRKAWYDGSYPAIDCQVLSQGSGLVTKNDGCATQILPLAESTYDGSAIPSVNEQGKLWAAPAKRRP